MLSSPVFPTPLHRLTADTAYAYFSKIPFTDTVLVVNSCARGQADPESDLDMAVLVHSGTTSREMETLTRDWQQYLQHHPRNRTHHQPDAFTCLHLDVISGAYTPAAIEAGEPLNFFEVEIGNQVRYAAPMADAGPYFTALQHRWLPYYDDALRLQRLGNITSACRYDLGRIAYYIRRGLHFHAFDVLYKAFQEYLQALFIANRMYPIAYNKWIKYQVAGLLNQPELHQRLGPVLSVKNIESDEMNEKAALLHQLLNELKAG